MTKRDRFIFNNVDGCYCAVLSGEGNNDFKMLTARLDLARIHWENDSDDLSLELVNPTITQALTLKQLCNELNRTKPERFF